MAVRIPLKVISSVRDEQAALEITAVVNTGFETDRPELLVPAACAEALGLYPEPPGGARAERYETAGGSATFWRLPDCLRVGVLEDPPKESGPEVSGSVPADALVSEPDREALINDMLAGDLGIVILNARTGDWRLSTDPADRVRRTRLPHIW